MAAPITGGCHCGAIRYGCDEPYAYAVHCHCTMCRKSSGAAFMTWVCLPRETFSLSGEPVVRQTSQQVRRSFCPSCGAQIYMDYEGSRTIDVSIGTLDAPETVSVRDNIFAESRLPMMKGFDSELTSHRRFRDKGQ